MQERINHLFGRKEIVIEIEAEKTPSKIEAAEVVAKKFNSSVENITIRRIKGKFGSKIFFVEADVYNNPEVKLKFGTFKKRNKKKKKSNAGAKGGKK